VGLKARLTGLNIKSNKTIVKHLLYYLLILIQRNSHTLKLQSSHFRHLLRWSTVPFVLTYKITNLFEISCVQSRPIL